MFNPYTTISATNARSPRTFLLFDLLSFMDASGRVGAAADGSAAASHGSE